MSMLVDSYRFGPWTPASLPGLVLWLDPSDSSTVVEDGGTVLSIEDKSPSALTLTRVTPSGPTITPLNGLDALTYSGSQLLSAPQTMTQPYTAALVCGPSRVSAHDTPLAWGDSAMVGPYQSNNTRWAAYNGALLNSSSPVALNVPVVVTAIANTTSSAVRKNGATIASGTSGTNTSKTPLYVGAHGVSIFASYWGGQIGEIVVTDNVMAPADVTKLETYLMSKWGI